MFFITVCGEHRGENQLCAVDMSRAIFGATEFYHITTRWYVHLMFLMPDHVHLLASFPPDESMKTVVTAWKHFLAKQHGVRWQRDFFDHRLRGDEGFEEKAHYIRQNPVRAKLARTAAEWKYIWEPEA